VSGVNTAFDIVSLGEPLIELNQTGEGDGALYRRGYGGDTSNFAIAAARQGARVALAGAVGDDPFGRDLQALWSAEGIDHAHVRVDPDAFTGLYLVTHNADGHHFSFVRRGSAASRWSRADVPQDLIASARVLHLSGITLAISESMREAAFEAIAQARAAGVTVSFDTNLRLKLWPLDTARAVMREAMAACDVCLPSLDDLVALTGLREPEALVDHCLALGASVVGLKLGAAGAIVADASQRHRIAPHPCRPVDATGAGDTFGGAFMARRLAGDDLPTAGRYAAVAAALSTEGWGAVAPIPRAAQVRGALGQTARAASGG
jgi:2-dehydro-3-deoxygluconokinase